MIFLLVSQLIGFSLGNTLVAGAILANISNIKKLKVKPKHIEMNLKEFSFCLIMKNFF